jgi:hypothetical protein
MAINSDQLKEIERSYLADNIIRKHNKLIRNEIRKLGANSYDLLLPETHLLPIIVQPKEIINGIVYGRYKQDNSHKEPIRGRGLLLATDRRVILVDHKPLFLRCLEYPYRTIGGISYGKVGTLITIKLYSRVGNLSITTANSRAADKFVSVIQNSIETEGVKGA